MQTIKKSDSPLFYRLLQYGTLSDSPELSINDSCQKNTAIGLGFLWISCIPVVFSLLLILLTFFPIMFIYFDLKYTYETLVFISTVVWVSGIIVGLLITADKFCEYLASKIVDWKELTDKEKHERGLESKGFFYQMKTSYKSFKERYCEKVEIIND